MTSSKKVAATLLACALCLPAAAAAQTPTQHAGTGASAAKAVAAPAAPVASDAAPAAAPTGSAPAADAKGAGPVVAAAVLICTLSLIVLGFGLVAHGLFRTRQYHGERDWRFADALSEEATLTNSLGRPATVLVASSSRLIAVFGMIVILALYLGIGLLVLWSMASTGEAPGGLEALLTFMVGGGSLFVPYLFNQIKASLEKKPAAGSGGDAAATTGNTGKTVATLPDIAPRPSL